MGRQLKLSVPAQYSEAADGAALKTRAVRIEIAKRAVNFASFDAPHCSICSFVGRWPRTGILRASGSAGGELPHFCGLTA
jgi:hypothetical protein